MSDTKLYYDLEAQPYVQKEIKDGDTPIASVMIEASAEDVLQQIPDEQKFDGGTLDLTNFPKINFTTLLFVRWYFAKVFEEHRSEAIVLFHRDEADDDYTVIIPEAYSASSGHVTYNAHIPKFCTTCRIGTTQDDIEECPHCDTKTLIPFRFYGSAHSHGSMSAFHSGTDDEHEKGQTGFHITFGHVGLDKTKAKDSDDSAEAGFFQICPSFVAAIPGYTNEKTGHGDRWYPYLDELVNTDMSELFTAEQQDMVKFWTGRVLSPLLLGQTVAANPGAILLLDRCGVDETSAIGPKDLPVYLARTQEELTAMSTWQKAQPSSRKLANLTVSQYQEALKSHKQKGRSYVGGKNSSKTTTPSADTSRTSGSPYTGSGYRQGQGDRSTSPINVVLSITDDYMLKYYPDSKVLSGHVKAKFTNPISGLAEQLNNKERELREAICLATFGEAIKRNERNQSMYSRDGGIEDDVVDSLETLHSEILTVITSEKWDIANSEELINKFYIESPKGTPKRPVIGKELISIFDAFEQTDWPEEGNKTKQAAFNETVHGDKRDVLTNLWLTSCAITTLQKIAPVGQFTYSTVTDLKAKLNDCVQTVLAQLSVDEYKGASTAITT